MNKKFDEFMFCLNEQRYYDAHEVLEELWYPRRFEENNEVKLIKGFINASVSFELAKKGKIIQSKKVWKNYLKYRQLLYKTESIHINKYHLMSRQIENIKGNM